MVMKAMLFIIIITASLGITHSCIQTHDVVDNVDNVEEKNIGLLIDTISFELTRLLDQEKKKNYVYSSYSLMGAITPMASMLGSDAKKGVETCIGAKLKELTAFMYSRDDKKTIFNEATRIWMDETVTPNTAKMRKLSEAVTRLIKKVDIRNKPNIIEKEINDWVRNKTHGMIKDLIPRGSIGANTKMVITNAISFRAAWKLVFDKTLTKKRKFHVDSNTTIRTPTMAQTIITRYYRGDKIEQMVELPYKGDKYSMFVVLMKKKASIDIDTVTTAIYKMQKMKVKVILPKFQMTSSMNMKEYMDSMGLRSLFTKINVFDDRVKFTDILHKVSVVVDEGGMEASGGTAVLTARSMLPVFRANRPFYFFIKNLESDVILFSGKVSHPRS